MMDGFERRWVEMSLKHAADRTEGQYKSLSARIEYLESKVHRDARAQHTEMKSQAVQTSASMAARTDVRTIVDLSAFVHRLLITSDLGLQVTAEVRDAARKALGKE